MMRRACGLRLSGIFLLLGGTHCLAAGALARPAAEACDPAAPLAGAIARAASHFAIPEALIHAVIAAESNYAVLAVSPRGAMGLMQLMPGTWAELRLRYALGADPFAPCDNVFAGTAYLRELLDRYGDPGFLAAYNAGPGRYETWLRGGRPLPAETRAYVAKLASRGLAGASVPARTAPNPEAWRRGGLFVRAAVSGGDDAANARAASSPASQEAEDARPSASDPDSLFVLRTGVPR